MASLGHRERRSNDPKARPRQDRDAAQESLERTWAAPDRHPASLFLLPAAENFRRADVGGLWISGEQEPLGQRPVDWVT